MAPMVGRYVDGEDLTDTVRVVVDAYNAKSNICLVPSPIDATVVVIKLWRRQWYNKTSPTDSVRSST
jgi:hypothetical protein